MNIAIIGYGKMGKEVEKILSERGHAISKIIDIETHDMDLGNSDVAIIFSAPKSVYKHIINCLDSKVAIVCGSTGWTEKLEDSVNYCKSVGGSFIFSPNFSIGVNLFFKLNNFLGKIMKNHSDYRLEILEKHHTEKVDKPSGTAIKLADDIILNSNYSISFFDFLHSVVTRGRVYVVIFYHFFDLSCACNAQVHGSYSPLGPETQKQD